MREKGMKWVAACVAATLAIIFLVQQLTTRNERTGAGNREPQALPREMLARHDEHQLGRAAETAALRKAIERINVSLDKSSSIGAQKSGQTAQPGVGKAPATERVIEDNEFMMASMREIAPLIAECYANTLRQHPRLQGHIDLEFTIEGEPEVGGVVSASSVANTSTLRDPGLEECVRETTYTLARLPPPQNGGHLRLRYPMFFGSRDGGLPIHEEN